MTVDILLTSLPPSYLHSPPIAPALLKAAVERQGFRCRTVDFGMHCLHEVFGGDYARYLEWTQIFPDTYDFQRVSTDDLVYIDRCIDSYLHLVDQIRPTTVALSVFSWWQQRFAWLLCQAMRDQRPGTRILIGGMGIGSPPLALKTLLRLSYFEQRNSFGQLLMSRGLADHAIFNDGETELVRYLQQGQLYTTHADSNEVALDHAHIPNYDDYDLDSYFYINDQRTLLVQGSKGCVRRCVFCSEHSNYSRFYFKTGRHIAQELIALCQKYQVRKFQFTDSLVNGSLPMFREFVAVLAEHNNNHPDNAISWHGNYICRSKNNMRDQDYVLLKQSGGHGLTIGAESGSNRVLAEMKKQSTREDLLYEVAKFAQHDIDCTLLFMIGFYNETWQDFVETLDVFRKLLPYVYSNTVTAVRLGYTLGINDFSQYQREDFESDQVGTYGWIYKHNPGLDLRERVRRRIIAQEFCDEIGIPVAYAREDLLILTDILTHGDQTESTHGSHH